MSRQAQNNLSKELRSAGATDSEINELVVVVSKLKQLKKTPQSSSKTFISFRKLLPVGVASLTGLVVGTALIIVSQTVLPGNGLYPIQKLSDNLIISVNADYRGTVMMKRAQQVKQLIMRHASSKLVLATLADYQTEAAAYHSGTANYAEFEYCKDNLQQASRLAPPSEQQAINNVVQSLKDV